MQNKYLLLAIHPNRMAGGFSNMWKRTDHLTKKKTVVHPEPPAVAAAAPALLTYLLPAVLFFLSLA